jgi:hypothetical protein
MYDLLLETVSRLGIGEPIWPSFCGSDCRTEQTAQLPRSCRWRLPSCDIGENSKMSSDQGAAIFEQFTRRNPKHTPLQGPAGAGMQPRAGT